MYRIIVDQTEKKSSIGELVDSLLNDAIAQGASDIHLEAHQNGLRLRYRLDGMLYDQTPISDAFSAQVVARLKICAMIDIAQKRIPQDGKFRVQVESRTVDLRVSTFPAVYGEKIVIRILDRAEHMITLDQLGMDKERAHTFCQMLEKPNGFIMATGPTGSGKTTTLYAALNHLHSPEKNIITLEDPVEYNIEGITQGQIHPEAGFTFAKGIRSLLRQDPDIAMVGEIRDVETARTAIEASLTGHLVLSTLHTNDALSAVMRLRDMGIEPFLLNASLSCIVAQRLVRTICSACKISYQPTDDELALVGEEMQSLFKGRGCAACFNTGYKGRVGIFELLPFTDQLRSLLITASLDKIKSFLRTENFVSMYDDGIGKVRAGKTTMQELLRVIS